LGIETALSDNNVLMHTMRKVHRLGATWELLFDPVTFCFLFGGMALIAIHYLSSSDVTGRARACLRACGKLALIVFAWLPLRSGLLMALFLHRALRTDFDDPLALTGQFYNPWLHLLLLAVPVLLVWRFLNLEPKPAAEVVPEAVLSGRVVARRIATTIVAAAAVALFVIGQFWDPPGERKPGRIAVDERHSNWERTDRPMNTERYGQISAYNYSSIYDYLSQFYATSRFTEPLDDQSQSAIHSLLQSYQLAPVPSLPLADRLLDQFDEMSGFVRPIDDAALKDIDVLIVKTPTRRYKPSEVATIVRFVERGGGLMLIGEHTDVFHTGEYLNAISRNFGFSFRYDCLFGIDSPFEELYTRPLIAHPIVERMPPLDFEISCSLDPGKSSGHGAMTATGLWNLPPDYHANNFYPQVEDRADARYGAWVQTWAMRPGAGRIVAYTDSTQFSNFSTFEPGKPEVMIGMVEWLNHRGGATWLSTLFSVAAVGLALVTVWLARSWTGGWLMLVGAGFAGWFAGAELVRAAHQAELPLPTRQPRMIEVAMDRTVSDAPLPKGGFISGSEQSFGIFERNMLRLGYSISRRTADLELADADGIPPNLLVVLNPSLDVPSTFRDAVKRYVENGGRLLVLDSPQNEKSTANSLLYPFALAVDHSVNYAGTLATTNDWPAVAVNSSCPIIGGDPLITFNGAPPGSETLPIVAATTKFGKGSATVIGFAGRFSDFNMGVTGDLLPDADMRNVYDVEYRLLRRIIGK
jgi:hypothetical protein